MNVETAKLHGSGRGSPEAAEPMLAKEACLGMEDLPLRWHPYRAAGGAPVPHLVSDQNLISVLLLLLYRAV